MEHLPFDILSNPKPTCAMRLHRASGSVLTMRMAQASGAGSRRRGDRSEVVARRDEVNAA